MTNSLRSLGTTAQRVMSIQAFRGVAAMLVVLLHLHNAERKYFHTQYLGFGQYGWTGVDLFFVISGVVMSLVTVGKYQNLSNGLRFIYHRFARIYPTFWFYYLLILFAYLYNPLWINASTGHKTELLRSFFLIPNRYRNLVGQAWTLSYELNFYIVFFLLLSLIPERIVPFVLIAWGSVIGIIDYFTPIPYDWYVLWVITNPFIWEFLAGCFLFQIYTRIPLQHRLDPYLIAFSALMFGAVVIWTNRLHGGDSTWLRNSYFLRPFLCGAIGGSLILGFMLLEQRTSIPLLHRIAKLGDWSYSIYLSHEIVVEAIARAFLRWWHNMPAAMLLISVIAIPATAFIGYLGYTFVEYPLIIFLYKPSRQRIAVPVA